MLGHECRQLGDQLGTAAELQVCLDAVLDGGQPELFQPGAHWLEELHLGDVEQHRTAPQAERLAQGTGGPDGGRCEALPRTSVISRSNWVTSTVSRSISSR